MVASSGTTTGVWPRRASLPARTSARLLSASCRRGDHAPDRDLGRGQPGAVEAERGRHASQRHLVGPHGARQGVLADARDEVRPTDQQPRLGTADQLVAAEADEVRARCQALHRRRLVRQPEGGRVQQRAGAQVVDHDRAELMGHRGQRGGIGLLDEALHPEVGRMDAQDGDRGAGLERLAVVGDPGAVRGADLDEPQSRRAG